ncbi:MAG: UDP-phosphate galactose phosphotransferase [Gemmatimonadota bacterium]|nr:MAG: UDP-phosphate galactose phosphotransferase [Gemmatimonadota bacterium]
MSAVTEPSTTAPAGPPESPPRDRSRPSELSLVITAMLLDAAVLVTGFVGAHMFRFDTGLFQGPSEPLRIEHWWTLVILLPTWVLLHGANGLYRPRSLETTLDQIVGVMKAVSLGCLFVLALGFLTKTSYFYEKRLVLIFAWLFTMTLSLVVRFAILRPFYRRHFSEHSRHQRIVIVGAGVEGTRFLARIRENEALSYDVVAFVDDDPAKHGMEIDGVRVHGSADILPEVVREVQADQVFVAIPSLGQEGTLAMMSRCMTAGLPVRLVNDILHLIVADTQVETIDGVPTYEIRTDTAPQLSLFIKRAFDLLVAGGLLLCFFPLFLFIAMLIKIFSPGPVLFRQVRAGQFGSEFTMSKFRTMRLETDDAIHREYATNFITGKQLEFTDEKKKSAESVFKMTKDPRITPIGAILRRTSLDELPQLLNVVRGEMSVVGPRPPIFYELNHYKEWHKKRLRAKPGLTGLWQVSGRSTVPFDEMVLLDLYYIDHWSLKTDLEILFRTIPVVLYGEGAY